MATIEIPDRLIPEGYELTGEFRVPKIGDRFVSLDRDGKPRADSPCTDYHCHVALILRRKPRKLKAVVFEPAGEARTCRSGEWIDCEGKFCQVAIPTLRAHVPFIRREAYEGDDDAAK